MRGTRTARSLALTMVLGAIAAIAWAGAAAASAQGAEIRGKVTGHGGAPPLAEVKVCLTSTSVGGGPLCEASDVAGQFTFSGLPAGADRISFEPPETLNYQPVTLTTPTLAASSVIGLEEQMAVGAEFTGHLTDASTGLPIEPTGDPATTTKVCAIEDWEDEVVKCVPVRAGGEYVLAGLPTGAYVISFAEDTKEGGVVVSADGFVRQYYKDKPDFEEGRVELIEAGAVATGIDATLVRGAEIWPDEEESAGETGPGTGEIEVSGPIDGGGSNSPPESPPGGAIGVVAPLPPLALTPPPRHTVLPNFSCRKGFHRVAKGGTSRCVKAKPKPNKHRPRKHHKKATGA